MGRSCEKKKMEKEENRIHALQFLELMLQLSADPKHKDAHPTGHSISGPRLKSQIQS